MSHEATPGITKATPTTAMSSDSLALQVTFNVLLATRYAVPARLAEVCGVSLTEIVGKLDVLSKKLEGLGLTLQRSERGYFLERTPEVDELVEQYRGGSSLREETLLTLALLARRGASTMPEIARIRRVDNIRQAFDTLVDHGLIESAGRRSTRGRPMVYQVTEAGNAILRIKRPGAES